MMHPVNQVWVVYFLTCMCLVFITKESCASASSGKYVINNEHLDPIYLETDVVEPFDYKVWIDKSKRERTFPIIGPVKDIGNFLAKPQLFPASFSVYTREGSTKPIKFEPLRHCFVISGETKEICKEYEYNLTLLTTESNPFRYKRRTIITIPGYKSSANEQWTREVREKWLEFEDVNVIDVHWPEGNQDIYYTAVANSRLAARELTIFLYYLAQMHSFDFGSREFRSRIHIVGHSLGAHMAGAVGQELRGQVGRITGLDPAGPSFDKMEKDDRLDPSDGLLVDVIHTNAGVITTFNTIYSFFRLTFDNLIYGQTKRGLPLKAKDSWWGINTNLGHLDYWPNGGSEQPGCHDETHNCEHRRACDLYVEFIDNEILARKAYGAESQIIRSGKHRFHAFLAHDYKELKIGKLHRKKCEPTGDKACNEFNIVPIDFVTHVDEYRRQLIQDYGVQLGSVADDQRRLYFDTQATKPWLSEQYLLRAHLSETATELEVCSTCKLNLVARGQTAETYSIIAQDLVIKPVSEINFYGLTMAFASTNNWLLTYPKGDELDRGADYRSQVPAKVEIEVNCPEPSKIERFFGAKSGQDCKLSIESLDAAPLYDPIVNNASAWYLSESESKVEIPVRQYEELIQQTRGQTIVLLNPAIKPRSTLYLTAIGTLIEQKQH